MKLARLLFFSVCVFFGRAWCGGDTPKPSVDLHVMNSAITAGVMGAVGAVVQTPLRYRTTMLQCDAKPSWSPSAMWRGTHINALRSAPNLAVQLIIMGSAIKKNEHSCDQQTAEQCGDKEKLTRAVLASTASTVISTPIENVNIQRKQDNSQSCLKVTRDIVKKYGLQYGLYRSFWAKWNRNLPGDLGYWYAAPELKKGLMPYLNNEKMATIVAGGLVGGVCAAATNSLDAVSTKMQDDLAQKKLRHFTHAALELKGTGLMHKGLFPRTIAGIIGFPLARLTQDFMTNILNKINPPAK